MPTNDDLRTMIIAARAKGAVLRTWSEGGNHGDPDSGTITHVEFRYGTVPGAPPGKVSASEAWDIMRDFVERTP